jgi:hypothetical protein
VESLLVIGAKAILVLVLLRRRELRDRHFKRVVAAVLEMNINVRKEKRQRDKVMISSSTFLL